VQFSGVLKNSFAVRHGYWRTAKPTTGPSVDGPSHCLTLALPHSLPRPRSRRHPLPPLRPQNPPSASSTAYLLSRLPPSVPLPMTAYDRRWRAFHMAACGATTGSGRPPPPSPSLRFPPPPTSISLRRHAPHGGARRR
jgi:hypothetical protein